MRKTTFAALQYAHGWDIEANVAKAEMLVRQAAAKGANVILISELFETPYFCSVEKRDFYGYAKPVEGNPTIAHFQALAKELGVVLPISFYERANNTMYNSAVVADADGRLVGHYRKSHIPQFLGYEEKFYFSPGDTGLKPIDTVFGKLGLAICWDQWFPEVARSLVLQGAEFLMYPTAIGSEPSDGALDSMEHWRMVMRGHAASNMVPVIASNRIGTETVDHVTMSFYGSSFIAGPTGAMVAEADRMSESFITASFDLDETAAFRMSWGPFRDRRPELYGAIMTMDGNTRSAAFTP
jgi:N-carbamoylputrescine amidase